MKKLALFLALLLASPQAQAIKFEEDKDAFVPVVITIESQLELDLILFFLGRGLATPVTEEERPAVTRKLERLQNLLQPLVTRGFGQRSIEEILADQ